MWDNWRMWSDDDIEMRRMREKMNSAAIYTF
jgi:hypothetical protein